MTVVQASVHDHDIKGAVRIWQLLGILRFCNPVNIGQLHVSKPDFGQDGLVQGTATMRSGHCPELKLFRKPRVSEARHNKTADHIAHMKAMSSAKRGRCSFALVTSTS